MSNETPNYETPPGGLKPGDPVTIQGTVERVDHEAHEVTIRDARGRAHVADLTVVGEGEPEPEDERSLRVGGRIWTYDEARGGYVTDSPHSPVLRRMIGMCHAALPPYEALEPTFEHALARVRVWVREGVAEDLDRVDRQAKELTLLDSLNLTPPTN